MMKPGAWNIGAYLGLSDSDAQILYFAGSLILAAALVGVTIYYALQNKRMVDELRKQNRPYLFIVCKPVGTSDYQIALRNGGARVAQQIAIEITHDAHVWQWSLDTKVPMRSKEQRVKISELPECKSGIPSLAPGADHDLGRAKETPALGLKETLSYRLSYPRWGRAGIRRIGHGGVPSMIAAIYALALVALLALLAGCTSTEAVRLRSPSTGQQAQCGPYTIRTPLFPQLSDARGLPAPGVRTRSVVAT